MSSPDFRVKKIDETRNYILEEIKYNNLMIEKAQKEIKCLNYVEQLLVFQFLHLLHQFPFS